MSVSTIQTITIVYTGDVTGTETITSATNAASPGVVELKTLASGFNTITLPTGGATVVSCVIVPPPANVVTLTLKGVTGDTGIPLHLTEPSKLTFAVGTTTFGLTTSNTLTGIRLYWS